jgi:hypothetical protein
MPATPCSLTRWWRSERSWPGHPCKGSLSRCVCVCGCGCGCGCVCVALRCAVLFVFGLPCGRLLHCERFVLLSILEQLSVGAWYLAWSFVSASFRLYCTAWGWGGVGRLPVSASFCRFLWCSVLLPCARVLRLSYPCSCAFVYVLMRVCSMLLFLWACRVGQVVIADSAHQVAVEAAASPVTGLAGVWDAWGVPAC